MDIIDQVLWEQELAEHLHRDTKQRDGTRERDEPVEFEELALLNGIEELDGLHDTPRAEPPVDSNHFPALVEILLWSLAIVVVSSIGWLIGYFVV